MITKKEAQAYIDAIIALRDSATDKQASEAAILYPEWEIEKEYAENTKILYKGKLYKALQAHVSKAENTPDNSNELYYNI